MEIVIYDEIEKFRAYSNPEFPYPYERRKITLSEFTFDLDVPESPDGKNYDYIYKQDMLEFRISQVCLEAEYYNQIDIFGNVAKKGNEVWNNWVNNATTQATDEFYCESEQFEKLKYEKDTSELTNYKINYEKGLINDRILF